MTNPIRMLEGDVEELDRSDFTTNYAARCRELEAENGQLRQELQQARIHMSALRKQLGPLYRALQGVFGELPETMDPEDLPSAHTGMDARIVRVWNEWKVKLGSRSASARVIEALMTHRELNVAQLKVTAKMATQTVYDATSKLNRLGLINKNGGRYSLKKI